MRGSRARARVLAPPRIQARARGFLRCARLRPAWYSRTVRWGPPPGVPVAQLRAQQRPVPLVTLDQSQEFLVQPVDASWLQCNIECQEACPVGTNCRGYLNLAAEGRFEEGYILSREPNPVAAMCSYVCSAPCERACRRGDIDRPLAIRAMKRFLDRKSVV